MQQAGPHAALLLCILLAGSPARALAATSLPRDPIAQTAVPDAPAPFAPADGPLAAPQVDPTAHRLEATAQGMLVRWQSQQPATGWVLYGDTPESVTHIALDPAVGDAPSRSHAVPLPYFAGRPLYYIPVVDGLPARKLGAPFLVESAPLPLAGAASSGPSTLADDVLGLQLRVPDGWIALQAQRDLETEPLLQLSATDGAWMAISRVPPMPDFAPETIEKPSQLERAVDRQWGAGAPVQVAQLTAGPAQAYAHGVSCTQAAMLDTLVETPDDLIRVSYLAPYGSAAPSSGYISAYAEVLESLRTTSTSGASAAHSMPVPAAFAALPAGEPCPAGFATSRSATMQAASTPTFASTSAYRCAGAPMFVPVVARSVGPWNCLDDAAYCSPYFSNSPIAYFTQPHRGIDLRADEGETPVHAPYSGTVYTWGTSSMQLIFDAPYNGMSSYYAHMASNDGARDYRVARGGDHALAGESLLGFVGSFGTNAAWPHLHLAFSATGNGAEGPWPTLDPTPFLSALDLVYFPGWSGQRSPVRCAAERADAFEPDNFHSVAATLTVDSTPQRHDFHAPNDDDWSAVELVAGVTYRIDTLDLEARSDTQIAIFDAQGKRLLAANDDDSGLAAGLDYTPTTSGGYLVRVRHSSWRGYTFEASGRARYAPPVFGSDTGYSLRVATNLLLGREVTSLLNANATTGAPAGLSNDGLLATAWLGGCPLALPDNPVTPGPTPLTDANSKFAHWLAYDVDGMTMSDLLINWGEGRPTSFVVGWSEDGEVVNGLRYLPGQGEVQRILWPERPVRWLVLVLEGDRRSAPPADDGEQQETALPSVTSATPEPACLLGLRELSAWNLAVAGDGGDDSRAQGLPAPSLPVGGPQLLTRTAGYFTASYFLPLAMVEATSTSSGD